MSAIPSTFAGDEGHMLPEDGQHHDARITRRSTFATEGRPPPQPSSAAPEAGSDETIGANVSLEQQLNDLLAAGVLERSGALATDPDILLMDSTDDASQEDFEFGTALPDDILPQRSLVIDSTTNDAPQEDFGFETFLSDDILPQRSLDDGDEKVFRFTQALYERTPIACLQSREFITSRVSATASSW